MSGQSAAGRYERVCVVGLGGHAQTKLVPALEANGQEIVALVSSQAGPLHPSGATIFPDLATALREIPRGVLIVVATPPALHFQQVTAAVTAGFDVVVEKPAFATAAEAMSTRATAALTGALVVEGFMHRHTHLYERALLEWSGRRSRATSILIRFTIPQMPANTFRAGGDPLASSLYDIGCYPISLLQDLGLDLAGLSVSDVRRPGRVAEEWVQLTGVLDGIKIIVEVGVAQDYANLVSWCLEDGTEIQFTPFFFGRAGERQVQSITAENRVVETFFDRNAFERMFVIDRAVWTGNQAERWNSMISAADCLERLAGQLSRFRRQAPD